MKIAVVDHIGNPGGGCRVVRGLLPSIVAVSPEAEVVYFGNRIAIQRENFTPYFENAGIKVEELKSLRFSGRRFLGLRAIGKVIEYIQIRYLQKNIITSLLPILISGSLKVELEKRLREFDIVFFPWPFFIELPRLPCPIIATFHDFNFKYYFGGASTFTPEQLEQLNLHIPNWLDNCTPVVSSYFIASELVKFYPMQSKRLKVAHLPALGGTKRIQLDRAKMLVKKLGIREKFILCPTHMCSHKNLGSVFSAMNILREEGYELKLVITGMGTEKISGQSQRFGMCIESKQKNIVGLGYVSNEEMNSLIQCAEIVVNPSLYEAGNGPGIDAWGLGTPVAMSDIPAFIEHTEILGVRAEVFDPLSPAEIAEKIKKILKNPDVAKADAEYSRYRMLEWTWDNTAREYVKIFSEAKESR